MAKSSTIGTVIIGASHAGAQVSVSLRQAGYDRPITLIGEEADWPYHRPPLSKTYLAGDKTIEDIHLRPAEVYAGANIDVRRGVRVGAIDRPSKTILMDTGETLGYDTLVLATGARVRRLPVPGAELDGVYYLRDAADVRAIQTASATAKRAVIIGGGYIGLETAASLRTLGLKVTVLEAMPRILQRVTAPELSDFYRRVHNEEGVIIREGVIASEIIETKPGLSVLTSCGQNFAADLVIIGIGVIPNTELAEVAGLKIGNGIEVDEFCRTSDPDIYAAGDVTWHYNSRYGRHVRLESVPNATEQAKTIARHIMDDARPYDALPWFWSDQFDLKLQIAGLSDGYDEVIVRGDATQGRSFAAYYFKAGRFIAVDAVNAPRDFMFGRQCLTRGVNLDRTSVPDLSINLKSLVLKAGG